MELQSSHLQWQAILQQPPDQEHRWDGTENFVRPWTITVPDNISQAERRYCTQGHFFKGGLDIHCLTCTYPQPAAGPYITAQQQ